MEIGGIYQRSAGTCALTVWAPLGRHVDVKIVAPDERAIPMERIGHGYWRTEFKDAVPGTRYFFRLDGEKERPDPASRFQPGGVHGPSELIDHGAFRWNDDGWRGPELREYVLYELHVGTFTREGTFDAILPNLDYFKELGITAIELMPVAQFPGPRNWGYDGVYPYAVQNSYGGPEGLKRLVNACHQRGLAVVLDVVYNHLGPEGNYLWDYGPYFTDRYKTPWGDAVNFDGPRSGEVRGYFIGSALAWIRDYHIDALRVDAVHGIFDLSAKHFLQELGETVRACSGELRRNVYVIAESDLNDVRLINPVELGGYGIDAQWNDDFHHALHTLLTGERGGYYGDFGKIEHFDRAMREGFVYSGQYSEFRKRKHGSSSKDRPAGQFVVFSQNHDQVGNRMQGERLSSLVTFERRKLAAGAVLLSPFIPLLFMGEEYGETATFQYFVSHGDEALIEAVRKGRREEFSHFQSEGEVPDPQSEETFTRSKLNFSLREEGKQKILLDYYRRLLGIRRSFPVLRTYGKAGMETTVFEEERALFVRHRDEDSSVFIIFSFNDRPLSLPVVVPEGKWAKVMDSSSMLWGGGGERAMQRIVSYGEYIFFQLNPHSIVLYVLSKEGR